MADPTSQGFVGGEGHRLGLLDSSGTHGLSVAEQGDIAALAQTAPVIGEFHSDLMAARGESLVGCDVVVLDAEKVVAVLQPVLVRVQAPAADSTALTDDHAGRSGIGHRDVSGHRVRLVLDVPVMS